MSKASDLVRDFRTRQIAGQESAEANPRHKRALAAFALAALTVIPAIAVFGPYASSVLAFEDSSAAAFFRNDRAMQQRARAQRTQPAAQAPSRTATQHNNRRNSNSARTVQQAGRPATAPLAYAPAPVSNNPLAALFGGARQQTPASVTSNHATLPAAEPKVQNSRSRKTAKTGDAGSQEGSGKSASGQAVCVRLCDGFHFPVGNTPASGELAARESMCTALCPGAPVRLYVLPAGTDDISQAYSPRRGGRTYGSLPVALRHTQKFDNTCTCRPQGQPHAALVPITQDFTLRKGDAAMTGSGFRVFNGAARWPYRNGDFVPLNRARNVAGNNRATLRAIERVSRIQPGYSPVFNSPVIAQPALIPLPPRRPDQRAALTPAR